MIKIGDSVYVHGYIDEIRKDTVIIRNDGGYFGTVLSEIVCGEMPERKKGKWMRIGHWGRSYKCDQCGNYLDFDGVNVGRGDANFCPNCGARMEGEG